MGGESAAAAGFCAGLAGPVRVAYEAGRPGTGWRASSRGVALSVSSRRRARSRGRPGTGSRPTVVTPSCSVRLLLAGELHPVRVPGDEEEALRDLVRAREAVRVDLMRARHRLSKLLLRHGIRFDDGRAWTARHRDWLATVTLDWPAAQTTLLDCRGAIDALTHRREQLEREIIALLPTLAMAGAGRAVALPARHRHADRRRAVRRDRRLRTIRPSRAADELRRPRPERVEHRPAAPARRDHQDRLQPRQATARRGGLALPRPPEHRQGARATAKTASHPKRSRSPGQPNDACTEPGRGSRHARNAARSSPSPPPANSPASAGQSPASNETSTTHNLIPSTGPVAARHARGTRDRSYEQPAPTPGLATPDPRQRLPTTNHGPAAPNPRISA